jgi:two-component system chemotaxis sensor kinase CheA
MLLLFRAGNFSRLVLPLSMVARLEEIARARIEYAAGTPVVRYREGILPLISLASLLEAGSAVTGMTSETLQVIVFSEGERSVGIVVDEILDIVDDAVTIKRPGSAAGLLGSAVVGGKVTDFVDLAALLKAARGGVEDVLAGASETGRKLLLVDSRKIPRGIMRSYLEMHGHHVVECTGMDDALRLMERTPVDAILTAVHLGERSGLELLKAIRGQAEFMALPVLGLTTGSELPPDQNAFTACFSGEDRGGLLRAIQVATGPLLEPANVRQTAGS